MCVTLSLFLILALSPAICVQNSFEKQSPYIFPPSSLADCANLSSRQVYDMCVSIFLQAVPHSQQSRLGKSGSLNGVMVTDAHVLGQSDISAGVTSVYAHKRTEEINPDRTHGKGESLYGNISDEKNKEGDEKRQWKSADGDQRGWLAVFRRAVLRTRRQHALSINSALVSLADMVMANDYRRERARQRAFREQLLGLGR